MEEELKCLNCGIELDYFYKNKKYCSPKCGMEYRENKKNESL